VPDSSLSRKGASSWEAQKKEFAACFEKFEKFRARFGGGLERGLGEGGGWGGVRGKNLKLESRVPRRGKILVVSCRFEP